MNYSKVYFQIIEKAKVRTLTEYGEWHHIIPKCLGGKNNKDNLVFLTAREHYICHQLLVKMNPNNSKLLYAANMMVVHNTSNRSFNKRYEWIRKEFQKNHPCKNIETKQKISNTLNNYYSSEDYKRKSDLRKEKYRETRFCKCGCGQSFEVYKKSKKQYMHCSHSRPDYSNHSLKMKRIYDQLTIEEKHVRMMNQQKKMGEKYAKLSDEEFANFLKTKSPRIHTRIIRLREKWKK